MVVGLGAEGDAEAGPRVRVRLQDGRPEGLGPAEPRALSATHYSAQCVLAA